VFPEDGRENKINEIGGGLLLPFSLFELVLEAGKKTAQCAGGGDCTLQCLAFSEGNNVSHGILQAESISGTLRAQQFNFRRAKVRCQPGNFCLFLKRVVQNLHSSVLDACWIRHAPAGATSLGGRPYKTFSGSGRTQPCAGTHMLGMDIVYTVS